MTHPSNCPNCRHERSTRRVTRLLDVVAVLTVLAGLVGFVLFSLASCDPFAFESAGDPALAARAFTYACLSPGPLFCLLLGARTLYVHRRESALVSVAPSRERLYREAPLDPRCDRHAA